MDTSEKVDKTNYLFKSTNLFEEIEIHLHYTQFINLDLLIIYIINWKWNNVYISGICRSPNRTIEGEANSKLLWSSTGPYLNYTNGSSCDEGKNRHYTVISFICTPDNHTDPKIVIDEACYLKIEWPTPLVCEAKVSASYLVFCLLFIIHAL